MNRLLFARYRAIACKNPQIHLKAISLIETICRAVLTDTPVEATRSTSLSEFQSKADVSGIKVGNLKSTGYFPEVQSDSKLFAQNVLKSELARVENFSATKLDSSPIENMSSKSSTTIESKADLLPQGPLPADTSMNVLESKGILVDPSTESGMGRSYNVIESKATVLSQELLRKSNDLIEVNGDATVSNVTVEGIKNKGEISLSSDSKVSDVKVNGIKSDSTTALSSNSKISTNVNMMKSKTDIELSSNTKITNVKAANKAVTSVAKMYSRAVLSVQDENDDPTWEYPVLTGNVLKLTQVYSATQNNDVLEVI